MEGCHSLFSWCKYLFSFLPKLGLTRLQFVLPRATIYQVVCERLEMIDCITDAVECFRQMANEMGEDTLRDWTQG